MKLPLSEFSSELKWFKVHLSSIVVDNMPIVDGNMSICVGNMPIVDANMLICVGNMPVVDGNMSICVVTCWD